MHRVPGAFLFIIAYISDAAQHLVVLISWNRAPNSLTYKQDFKDKNKLAHSIRSPKRIYRIKWSIHWTTHRYWFSCLMNTFFMCLTMAAECVYSQLSLQTAGASTQSFVCHGQVYSPQCFVRDYFQTNTGCYAFLIANPVVLGITEQVNHQGPCFYHSFISVLTVACSYSAFWLLSTPFPFTPYFSNRHFNIILYFTPTFFRYSVHYFVIHFSSWYFSTWLPNLLVTFLAQNI
jgi:hypothetical protein